MEHSISGLLPSNLSKMITLELLFPFHIHDDLLKQKCSERLLKYCTKEKLKKVAPFSKADFSVDLYAVDFRVLCK